MLDNIFWLEDGHVVLFPAVSLAEDISPAAFSILSNSYSEKQTHSLQDYLETSVMLQYDSE